MHKPYYLDSSALVKRYVSEPGSAFIDNLFENNSSFFVSFLTYAEVYATLGRICRMGYLSSMKKNESIRDFEEDWQDLSIVDYSEVLRLSLPSLAERFPLTGADSIQLASAVSIRNNDIDLVFLTSDNKLFNAAEDFGLKVIDPSKK